LVYEQKKRPGSPVIDAKDASTLPGAPETEFFCKRWDLSGISIPNFKIERR